MDTFTNPELLTDLKNMLGDGYKTEEHSTPTCCYNNYRLRSYVELLKATRETRTEPSKNFGAVFVTFPFSRKQ